MFLLHILARTISDITTTLFKEKLFPSLAWVEIYISLGHANEGTTTQEGRKEDCTPTLGGVLLKSC